MTRHRYRSLLVSVLLFTTACSTESTSRNETVRAPLDAGALRQKLVLIDGIGRIFSDDISYRSYFENPGFRDLYTNPYWHRSASIELWKMTDVPIEMKKLSVRLLQCLPLPEYVALMSAAFADYKAGDVPADVVETLISPGSNFGTHLGLAYRDTAVSSALKNIANDAAASAEMREQIAWILTGKDAEFVREYNLPSEPLPNISCTSP